MKRAAFVCVCAVRLPSVIVRPIFFFCSISALLQIRSVMSTKNKTYVSFDVILKRPIEAFALFPDRSENCGIDMACFFIQISLAQQKEFITRMHETSSHLEKPICSRRYSQPPHYGGLNRLSCSFST